MPWTGISIKVLLSVISFLLVAGVTLYVAGWLRRKLRVRRDRNHLIHIRHQANFRAFYYLAVESTEPALRFLLSSGNTPLVDVSQPAPPAARAVETGPAAAPLAQPKPAPAGAAVAGKKAGVTDGAVKAGKQLAGKAGIVAGLLGALGNILPGRWGARLKAQSTAAKQMQVDAIRASQAPSDMQRKVEAVQHESGKLGVKAPSGGPGPASSSGNPIPASAMGAFPTAMTASPASVEPARHPFGGAYCAQTIDVSPGQTLPVTLNIDTNLRRYPAGSFSYTIRMQPVPVEPLQDKPPVLVKRGTVFFSPVASWRYWMPAFSSLVVVLSGLLAWLYLTTLIWK